LNSKVFLAAVVIISIAALVGTASAEIVVGGNGLYPLLIKTGPGEWPDDFTQVGWINVDSVSGAVRVETTGSDYLGNPLPGVGIREVHVQASPTDGSWFPLTASGNPMIGLFEVNRCFDPCVTDTGWLWYTVPTNNEEYYFLAVHVELCDGETAWGGRCPWVGYWNDGQIVSSTPPIFFEGGNWFFYFTVLKTYEVVNS
jgi:hypothetical protein